MDHSEDIRTPSDAIRFALRHFYGPERLAAPCRYLCPCLNEMHRQRLIDRSLRDAAQLAIRQAMRRELVEHSSHLALVVFEDDPLAASLIWVLKRCGKSHEPEDLRAWHEANAARLEAEGN